MKMFLRFLLLFLLVFFLLELVDLGFLISVFCLLNELGNIFYFLRKIVIDINEMKGMKVVILIVEVNFFDLNVRVF